MDNNQRLKAKLQREINWRTDMFNIVSPKVQAMISGKKQARRVRELREDAQRIDDLQKKLQAL